MIEPIEVCLNNVDAVTRQRLLASGLALIESSCLQRCGHCYAGPFLVIDGRLVAGPSHQQIIDKMITIDTAGREP